MTDPLRVAAQAVVAKAELDDSGYDGECLDYHVPIPTLDSLRAALAADTARPGLRCVKCGASDIHTRWERSIGDCGWDGRAGRRGRDPEFSGEHLHRHCRTCGYQWGDQPLDTEARP